MARESILNSSETTEINYRQVLAEFKEDIFPAFADEGITLGAGLMIYQLVCIENRLDTIEKLLEEKYA